MLAEVNASDQSYLLHIAIGALLMLGPALNAWLSFIKGLQKKEVSTADFVTQKQLAEVEARMTANLNQTVGAIKEQLRVTMADVVAASRDVARQLEHLKDAVNEEITALHRSLGTVEGQIKSRRN
jgi:hypothetical protein